MSARARGFRVSLFGVRLTIASDSAAMAETLDRYVLPWLPRAPLDGEPSDRCVEVRCAEHADGFVVLVDGIVTCAPPDPLAAIPPVQRALDETVVHRQRDVAVIHGGVVGHEGRVILLPGSTGAGKSTLVAELVRQGASYFSDEYALIDAAGRVHPYPRPLFLRNGPGDGRPVLASEMGGTVAREPIAVGLVLELRYAADAELTLRAVSQGEGMLLLLRNTPQALEDQPWILAPLERAVAGAACYAGARGEAREAAAAVLRLAASSA